MATFWDSEKLNKALGRIDGAIASGRYNLALKLAHRCLKQYYNSFIVANIPSEKEQADNVRLMAICICRYLNTHFRKYEIPYSERRLMFISLVSNVIFITTMNLYNSPDDAVLADKAMAMYARENVDSIISYMMRYFG